MLSSGHRRTAFALAENIRILAAKFGVERLGFLTLTFRDHVTDIREAQRRFNSLRTNVLAKRYPASIAVPERMASRRLHFHLLIVCPEDVRTGVDFDAIVRGDYRSAGSWLRAEWAFWRRTAPKFRFGRTELLPVRSTTEGIARYVGKYIGKHVGKRLLADKGARLVRYTASARYAGTRFAWAGVRPWLWRRRVAIFAQQQGCQNLEELRLKFGRRWAYHLAQYIAAITLEEYPSGIHACADGHEFSDDVDPREVRGPVRVKVYREEFRGEFEGQPHRYSPPPRVACAPEPCFRRVVQVVGDEVRHGWIEVNSGRFVGAGGESPPVSGARRSADSPRPG